ncbi:MAG: cytochrome C, partial [Chitinophagaceae bacterium]
PGLLGFTERGPWTNRKNVYEWIRNPAAFMSKNEYTKQLKEMYNGTMMTAFPDMTNDEIDAICDYIGQSGKNYE